MIKQIDNEIDANACDELLAKLIMDEKQYDSDIEDDININNYFNQVIKNKDNILLGYYLSEEIVGYIFIKKQNDNTCLLDGLFVEKEYRNKGIANSLIEEALKVCKKLQYKYVDINVMYKNEIAKNIYKKFGFEDFKINLRKNI